MPFTNRSRSADVLAATDERSVLEAFLDDQRQIIAESLSGLSEAEAHRPIARSGMTLLGLVTHAAATERFFFQRVLVDGDVPGVDGWSGPSGHEWSAPVGARIDDTVSAFEAACDESRKAVSAYPLDQVIGPGPRQGVTVRWIYLRMTEEHTRAAGQADVLRAQMLAQRDSMLQDTFGQGSHKRIGW